MIDPEEPASLAKMLGGDVVRRFDAELEAVAADILDPDKDPKAKRSVTLKVTFHPDEKRGMTPFTVACKASLADPKPEQGVAWVGQKLGRAKLVEAYDPRTPDLFPNGGTAAEHEHTLEEDEA